MCFRSFFRRSALFSLFFVVLLRCLWYFRCPERAVFVGVWCILPFCIPRQHSENKKSTRIN